MRGRNTGKAMAWVSGVVEWILGGNPSSTWNPEVYPYSTAASLINAVDNSPCVIPAFPSDSCAPPMQQTLPCDPFEKWSKEETTEIVPDRIYTTDNRLRLLVTALRDRCAWLNTEKFHQSRLSE